MGQQGNSRSREHAPGIVDRSNGLTKNTDKNLQGRIPLSTGEYLDNRIHSLQFGRRTFLDPSLESDHHRGPVVEQHFAGAQSRMSNVIAAIQIAQRLGAGRKVVTLMVDSGLKYVNTDVYRR